MRLASRSRSSCTLMASVLTRPLPPGGASAAAAAGYNCPGRSPPLAQALLKSTAAKSYSPHAYRTANPKPPWAHRRCR